MSWPSTSCFADSIAALSSAQSRTSDFMKCPSRLTTYARKWDIWLTLDRPGALPNSLSPKTAEDGAMMRNPIAGPQRPSVR
jgi:hypothetical protein